MAQGSGDFDPTYTLHSHCFILFILFKTSRYTLVYRIDVQCEINVQVGKFLKKIKRAGQNRCAGGIFWKTNIRAGEKIPGKLIIVA